MRILNGLLILATSALLISQAASGAVPCNQCFPLEKLPPKLRAKVESALLISLDSEGLYTFVGGLKPHSHIDEFSRPFGMDWHPDRREIEQINSALQCDNISIKVDTGGYAYFPFGVLFRSDLIKLKALQYEKLLSDVGISSALDGREIMLQFEDLMWPKKNMPVDDQFDRNINKLFGIFLGYPEFAAEFFTNEYWHSDIDADEVRIPTYDGYSNFVYVVPKGHIETSEEQYIRLRAEIIFNEYSKLRSNFIKDGKTGALQLLRTWYGDGKGFCSPDYADQK